MTFFKIIYTECEVTTASYKYIRKMKIFYRRLNEDEKSVYLHKLFEMMTVGIDAIFVGKIFL